MSNLRVCLRKWKQKWVDWAGILREPKMGINRGYEFFRLILLGDLQIYISYFLTELNFFVKSTLINWKAIFKLFLLFAKNSLVEKCTQKLKFRVQNSLSKIKRRSSELVCVPRRKSEWAEVESSDRLSTKIYNTQLIRTSRKIQMAWLSHQEKPLRTIWQKIRSFARKWKLVNRFWIKRGQYEA